MSITPVSNPPVSRSDSGKSPQQASAAGKATGVLSSGVSDLIAVATADGKPLDARIDAAQKKQSGATKLTAALQTFMSGVTSIFQGSYRLPSASQSDDQSNTSQSAVRNLLRQLNIKV